jgi:hypothetical protein
MSPPTNNQKQHEPSHKQPEATWAFPQTTRSNMSPPTNNQKQHEPSHKQPEATWALPQTIRSNMSPPTNNQKQWRAKHRFYAEIVKDITTRTSERKDTYNRTTQKTSNTDPTKTLEGELRCSRRVSLLFNIIILGLGLWFSKALLSTILQLQRRAKSIRSL